MSDYREAAHQLTLALSAESHQAIRTAMTLVEGSVSAEEVALAALERGLPEIVAEAHLLAARAPRSCPRCRTSLAAADVGPIRMQACGACGGVWLDNGSAREVTESLSPEVEELAQRAAHNAKTPTESNDPIPCPVCTETMSHTDLPHARVRLDVCALHGTWFDRSELVQLLQVMRKRQQQAQELSRAIRGAEVDLELTAVRRLYHAGYAAGRSNRYGR